MEDLKDKVFLITGAGSGIGAGIAIYLARNTQAKLVLVGKTDKNVQRISAYCEKSGGVTPLTIVADLTNDGEAERIINLTIEKYGKLDVLVNNAGVISMGGIKKGDMDVYDRVMNTNMRSVYLLTKTAVPHLIETKGSIINMSCIAGQKPSTMALAYNMSKAALDQFTKCVALELAPDGVRVNVITPGFVSTNLLKDTGLTQDQFEMYMKNVVDSMPLKKAVETAEIAAQVCFLASDKAKSITGSNLVIDGGSTLV